MPAVLAGAGTSSLIVLAVIALGAMLLATLFGQLTRRIPNSDGGLYAYARHEFGDFAGYLTGWCYWIQAWAGKRRHRVRLGLLRRRPVRHQAVGARQLGDRADRAVDPGGGEPSRGQADGLVPERHRSAEVPAAAVRRRRRLVLCLQGNFGAFNTSGGSLYSAIGIAAGVALFSFIGVEVAAITAKRVKDPRRNVGRASLLGTGASAVLYLLVCAAVMGLVPHHELVNNTAPFVTSFGTIFSHGAWAGKLVAALAVVSGIGALNGWTLVTTEVARAAASDGLFPRAFAWTDRRDTAWFGVVTAALLPSLLMLWSYTTKTGLTVFTDLVDLTVVTVAIPYLFSACAQLAYLVSRRRRVQGWQLARDLAIAGIGVLFSMWVMFAAGYQSVYQALIIVLIGVVLYAFIKGCRENPARPAAQEHVPAQPPAPQQA
jgi:APA family basic amino acid/polyamine antiporter